MANTAPGRPDPGSFNREVWSRGRFVRQYRSRQLRPVEVLLLARFREDFSGRVLELGCGAGRIFGYLADLASEAHGLDISDVMVAECRRRYPAGHVAVGDIRELQFADESLDAVVAGNNLIDIFDDPERRATLQEIRRVLKPDGLFVFSTHNRGHVPHLGGPLKLRTHDPLRFAYDLAHVPGRIRRQRRLTALERDERDYAIVSDGSHQFSLVHYYISVEAQLRQLEQEGFEPLVAADLDGHELAAGDAAPSTPEIHYAARKR